MSNKTLATISIGALLLVIGFSIYQQQRSAVQAKGDDSKVKIYEKDGYRYIKSNGIPNHKTGDFPNRGNPNRISSQKYKFKVPLSPKVSPNGIQMPMPPPPNRGGEKGERPRRGERRGPPSGGGPMLFGVALNGIPFDPGTAEAWNNDRRSGWNNEALTGKINLGVDMNNAHVQPTGAYHYHGVPNGLIEKLTGKNVARKMVLVGYAADGFPVYSQFGYTNSDDAKSKIKKMTSSYRLKEGTRPDGPKGTFDGTYLQDFEYVADLGDLDKCNGKTGVTPEYPKGIYHYYLTETFPFIPRCHRGTPDKSFQKGPPPGDRRGRRPPRGERPPRPF